MKAATLTTLAGIGVLGVIASLMVVGEYECSTLYPIVGTIAAGAGFGAKTLLDRGRD